MHERSFDLYKDIQGRTNGDIYIGVVGPVRTGKSTFIKRFVEHCIIPYIDDEAMKKRTLDELPQSAQGKTVMTTEPKFIPQQAISLKLEDQSLVRVRLIDCVGFAVEGANGYMEGDEFRMVKTPWFDEDVTFEEAAKVGTDKVILDHSTVGIIVTTDGSIGDLERTNYVEAERLSVNQLKQANKPFVIVLNTIKPYSSNTQRLKSELEDQYGVTVIPVNCSQMQEEDAHDILEKILYEFPVVKLEFQIPKWVEGLGRDHKVKQCIVNYSRECLNTYFTMEQFKNMAPNTLESYNNNDIIKNSIIQQSDLSSGTVRIKIDVNEKYYYENISDLSGVEINDEYELISLIRDLTNMKAEYSKVQEAFYAVQQKGYGVVMPSLEDIVMEDPMLIQHGSKYGVKMNAVSPSIHMIRANIETEIAPIVGNKEQAEDLIAYIKDGEEKGEGIWNTSIFGKSIGELMEDGIRNKISQMDDECQIKLQDTMQKIVNDSSGGMVCIII